MRPRRADRLSRAARRGEMVSLLLENGDFFETRALDCAGGERYPRLEREASRPDLLADVFRTRAGAGRR